MARNGFWNRRFATGVHSNRFFVQNANLWYGLGYDGWYGPIFWPYAFGDIFSYAFWPGLYYDPFWDYGPD